MSKSKSALRWAVLNVRGVPVAEVCRTRADAWACALNALQHRQWPRTSWEEFRREAKQRGYYLARVEIREVKR